MVLLDHIVQLLVMLWRQRNLVFADVVEWVNVAADDDLGTLAVARAVLVRAADDRRAQIARREAQDARWAQEEAAAASATRERERVARHKRRLSRLPGQLCARTLTSAIYCALAGWARAAVEIGSSSPSTDLMRAFAQPILVACLVSAGLAMVVDWFLNSPSGSFKLLATSAGLLIGAGEWVAFGFCFCYIAKFAAFCFKPSTPQ